MQLSSVFIIKEFDFWMSLFNMFVVLLYLFLNDIFMPKILECLKCLDVII